MSRDSREKIGRNRGIEEHQEPRPDVIVGGEEVKPFWDEKRRTLWLNGRLVKRYRQPAGNQEAILTAFQKQGWPAVIDDPLPEDWNFVPQVRLHEAIKALNRRQKAARIRFGGDGTGRPILWWIEGP